MLEDIIEAYEDEEFVVIDGFNNAIIGVDSNKLCLIYSVSKCISIIEETMSYQDAQEHFYFNICGAFLGEETPIFCDDNF